MRKLNRIFSLSSYIFFMNRTGRLHVEMEIEKLQSIISDVLDADVGELRMETEFVRDLGVDSLEIFQIVIGIEEKFDIALEEDEITAIVTVGDAVAKIRAMSQLQA